MGPTCGTLWEATRGAVRERAFFELSWSHLTRVSSTGGSLVGIGGACSRALAGAGGRWRALAGAGAGGSRQADEAAQARPRKYLPFSVLTQAGDGSHQDASAKGSAEDREPGPSRVPSSTVRRNVTSPSCGDYR